MKRGFTILELLVASLLLGMLVTILTMIFNQSSIAWRTGVAGVVDMDVTRGNIASLQKGADNVFFHGNEVGLVTGLWDENGVLRTRACVGNAAKGANSPTSGESSEMARFNSSIDIQQMANQAVGNEGGARSVKSYTVGVTSWGPDGEADTYDDITTWPESESLQ